MARWLAKPCHRLFKAQPMPELQVPQRSLATAPLTALEYGPM
jgi:hypothetical protein